MLTRFRAKVRRYYRRLTRVVSGAAWGLGLGGTSIVLLRAIWRDLSGVDPPLSIAGWGLVLVGSALIITVLRAIISAFVARPADVGVLFEEDELVMAIGARELRVGGSDVSSVLRGANSVWLLLSNGGIWRFDELTSEAADELERRLGTSRAHRIEPEARGRTALFGLVVSGMTCLVSGAFIALLPLSNVIEVSLCVLSALAFAWWMARRARGEELVVGRDGIRIGKAFFPFREIADVVVAKGKVTLTPKGEAPRKFRVSIDTELARALNDLVQAGVVAPEVEEEKLDRQKSESIQDWFARVRKAFEQQDFRHPVAPKVDAKTALSSPKTPLRVRVAAAAALSQSDAEHVRALLEETADPRMAEVARAALESPEALEELIRSMDDARWLEAE